MPKTHLTAQQQLDQIRDGLLPSRDLLLGTFLAEDCSRNYPELQRLISAGSPDTLRLWSATDGFSCLARTKSEARARYKKAHGKVPKGLRFSEG